MYFILTKPKDLKTDDDIKNQIISVYDKVFILPKNNINYYIDHGLFEKHLIEWSRQFCSKDKNMLDIGAHSGTYTINLAENCNNVYAFEPQKMTFYSLCGSVVLSNIRNATCINIGLGSEEQVGKQILNIVSVDGGGSSLHAKTGILETEEIEIRTLDSFNIDNIGFIKIDIEDNEFQALKGAKNTIIKSNYPKILFEMNRENTELLDYLKSLNYNIINIIDYKNMFLASH